MEIDGNLREKRRFQELVIQRKLNWKTANQINFEATLDRVIFDVKMTAK